MDGGKASALIRMAREGFPIPPFFVCPTSSSQEGILEAIEQKLPGAKYFAIRSSAENEDSKRKSFAGHFYSAVGVTKDLVYQEFRKVTDSFKGGRGAVIIQEFIPSDKAGVMFSEVDKDKVVINAIIGLCQPVVSGYSCDEYVFDKRRKLIEKNISKKKESRAFQDGRIVARRSPEESMTRDEIMKLLDLASRIQKFFGVPQDIEWCIKRGKMYVLQSRPITQDFNLRQEEIFFDSANIAESYSGIVSPLTHSFARFVYENAYQDLLAMSGVSRTKIKAHGEVFANLVELFYGRMYYNMNNWYRMTAFVPGYRRNKENFEQMITSNVKADIDVSISPSVWLKIFYPILAAIKVLLFGLTARRFRKIVSGEINRFQNRDLAFLDYSQCIQLFRELNKSLLHRWYVTLENDFFVMTYLGILKKFVDEKTLQKLIAFSSKATEQVVALAHLSKSISVERQLSRAVETRNAALFYKLLPQYAHTEEAVGTYLKKFGGRFANELKLESVGIDEDIGQLFAVLKVYRGYKVPEHLSPMSQVDLPFFKQLLFRLTLSKFKKYAHQREEFRLLRSNAFGVARHLFRRMGEVLVEKGILEDQDDVFYLKLEEVLEETVPHQQSFHAVVGGRKRDYEAYRTVLLPTHFSRRDGTPPQILAKSHETSGSVLQGRPCSPGVVRGRARVFKDFSIPPRVDFDILVASHTDPGWTALIALAKGLVIEHGGVLSHAAIVARELNIPAVIGVARATDLLKDNVYVEINGSNGSIKIIPS